ncbi:MAG: hypothetical protein MR510_03920 [Clostridium sp.]|uniref:hypothetical protein n=2 Tax=Clostridium TaxID=1485 RepID=UPI002A82825C|nr:hypothetical protein [Clostridium sp.]MCI6691627.1 hypothetical protein [Clostridium sp.]MDY4253172.1 hypothetical protein [Clostridium sp.]
MKKRFISIIMTSLLMLILSGCVNPESNEVINPFNDIQISETKRIEFRNLTITSNQKEVGRSKMITNEIDIKTIEEYLKPINAVSSNKKQKNPDFVISLIDNMDKEKSYISSIGISKNQIYIYKYINEETELYIYKYTDENVIKDLKELYNKMNYEEELLMKK